MTKRSMFPRSGEEGYREAVDRAVIKAHQLYQFPPGFDVQSAENFAKAAVQYAMEEANKRHDQLHQEKQTASKSTLNDVYNERNRCVAGLARMALDLGYLAYIVEHRPKDGESWEPEWLNVVFVHTPTGQMSWHIHERELPLFAFLKREANLYDGHSTEEKYRRLDMYANRMIDGEGQ